MSKISKLQDSDGMLANLTFLKTFSIKKDYEQLQANSRNEENLKNIETQTFLPLGRVRT